MRHSAKRVNGWYLAFFFRQRLVNACRYGHIDEYKVVGYEKIWFLSCYAVCGFKKLGLAQSIQYLKGKRSTEIWVILVTVLKYKDQTVWIALKGTGLLISRMQGQTDIISLARESRGPLPSSFFQNAKLPLKKTRTKNATFDSQLITWLQNWEFDSINFACISWESNHYFFSRNCKINQPSL